LLIGCMHLQKEDINSTFKKSIQASYNELSKIDILQGEQWKF